MVSNHQQLSINIKKSGATKLRFRISCKHHVHLGLLLLSTRSALADYTDDDDYFDSFNQEYREEMDHRFFVIAISLFFGIATTFLGTLFCYMAYLEISLLKRYLTEGTQLEADVISTECTRSGTVSDDLCFSALQKEFDMVVEYDQFVAPNYLRLKVQKNLLAMESDLINPNHPELGGTSSSVPSDPVTNLLHMAPSSVSDDENMKEKQRKKRQPRFIFNQDSFFQKFLVEERKLALIVLEGKPRSGFPVRQLKRRLQLRSWISPIMFGIVGFVLGIMSLRQAWRIVVELVDIEEMNEETGLTLVATTILFILLQGPCLHFALRGFLRRMLEEDYYYTGDLTPTGQDDSTLSSGSDTFLKNFDTCSRLSCSSYK